MPKVDFYLLNTADNQAMYRFLCRLVEKAYQQQYHAYIHTRSLEEAECLDNLLWTFRDTSFVPHQLGEDGENFASTRVVIATDKPKQHKPDILFNLVQETPIFFNEFSRIIEVITEEKQQKIQARNKYKTYKQHNCLLSTHRINLTC